MKDSPGGLAGMKDSGHRDLRGPVHAWGGCRVNPGPMWRDCPLGSQYNLGWELAAPAPGGVMGLASVPPQKTRLAAPLSCPLPTRYTNTQWPSCQIGLSEPQKFAINISCFKQHCLNNSNEI